MMPSKHAVISAGVSAALLIGLKSWPAAAVCFLSGVFIDIDHHLDYYLDRKKFPFRFQELVDFCANQSTGKLYLIFHSYEGLAFYWFLIYYYQLGFIWIGLAVGVTQHMICDQICNPFRPLSYFFIYRWRYGFERKYIFKEDYFQ